MFVGKKTKVTMTGRTVYADYRTDIQKRKITLKNGLEKGQSWK
jgi:hypothetical protein